MKILFMAHALAGGAAMLAACGQKGPLFLPTTPDAAGRATLPQSLNPRHAKPTTPAPAPASASGPATLQLQDTPASPPRQR